jgi:hypothetical protein
MSQPSLTTLASRVRALARDRALPAAPAPAAAEDAFNSLALDLFGAQFESVAPYRRWAMARGRSPETVADWRDLPAVPAAAFKEFEFTSLSPGERTAVFHSSGTTGQVPSRHFHAPESLELYRESLLPWFDRHLLAGCPPDSAPVLVSLTPSPADAPHSSLVYMFAAVAARAPGAPPGWYGSADSAAGWSLRLPELLARLAESASGATPLCLLGTAFSFVQVLDALTAAGRFFELPPGSRILETGGYKGRSRSLPRGELHELLEARLGIPRTHIVSEYGMSELSSQAYDQVVGRPEPRCFRFPPWTRALVVSPETDREVADGETGWLRVYDLANVWSVLAVQTEDLAVRRGEGFELLGRAPRSEARGCSLMSA